MKLVPARAKRRSRVSRQTRLFLEQLESRILLDSSIRFATTALSALESQTTVNTTVLIDPAAAGPAEFFVEVTGGTASNGTDYTPHTGHFQVTSGMTSITVELIHPIDDAADEPDETVTIRLVPVSGLTLGTPSTITVTIQDNDQPPPPPNPAGPAVITPDSIRLGQQQITGDSYAVSLASGVLSVGHALPSYQADIAPLELIYNSQAAENRPVFLVRYTVGNPAPAKVGAKLTFNGTAGQEVFYDTATSAGTQIQMALQANATGLATGRYSYQVDVTAYGQTQTTTTYTGQVSIVNGETNPVGEGWSIAGLDRLWPVSGGAILELTGGLTLWFAAGQQQGSFVSPAGDFSTLVQNQDGTFTRTLKSGVQMHFSSAGLLTSAADRNGNTTSFAYDNNGRIVSITDRNGLVTSFGYDGVKISSITDAAGRVTQLAHAGAQLTSIAAPDPDGIGPLISPVTTFSYDVFGRMTGRTDPRQYTTTFAYNFAGQVATITRPDTTLEGFVAVQSFGLVAAGAGTWENPAQAVPVADILAKYTDPRNNDSTAELDNLGFGLAVRRTDPLGNSTVIGRNSSGLPIYTSLGTTTNYSYDSQGNVTFVTLGDNSVYQYSYNAFGQVTQITEPDPDDDGPLAASVTRFVYDGNGNLLQNILPDDDSNPDNNPRYVFTYNSQGLVTSASDPDNYTTSYGYDSRDRLTQITYADDDGNPNNNPVVSLGYDAAGNLISRTDERGYVTGFAFDNLGRLTSITQPDNDSDPNNNPVETRAYDAAGNLTSFTNPLGQTTTLAYSSTNRLSSITGADPDGAGRRVQQ